MRKVVDSNFLQEPALRTYLAGSAENFAVITDYAAMEAYKARTLDALYKSMAVLSDYPRQVLVLKSTLVVCGLSGSSSGLQRRLIDVPSSRRFPEFCRHLTEARNGSEVVQAQLLENQAMAQQQIEERMLMDANNFPQAINGIAQRYTDNELRSLRTRASFSSSMKRKLIEDVIATATIMLSNHPKVHRWPTRKELPNTFIFRVALCAYLLAIDWISSGGANRASAKKLRNDMVDVNFAAFATYFDGLLSKDEKCQRIHTQARYLLDAFGCHISAVK